MKRTWTMGAVFAAAALAMLGAAGAQAQGLGPACDDSLKSLFHPDADTRVVAVKAFHQGDSLVGTQRPPPAFAPVGWPAPQLQATSDLCMVKLMVGPGNPGPAGAPSTSDGIGVEIWLPSPANWNHRFHALGGGGWQGGPAGTADVVANFSAATVALTEGAVSSSTDTGHTSSSGAFAMKPDGSINHALWEDLASRSLHVQAVETKALAKLYYGVAPKYSYWDGGSQGGRQGMNLAQNHPDDFDGIIALYPAVHWTRFITGELYPQLLMQRDLGGHALTVAQLNLASNAAIAACDQVGGQHLGYIPDPSVCTYDPVADPAVLCASDGGSNQTADCLTKTGALVIDKIWYGMTRDGSVPSPAVDNGWKAASGVRFPDGLQTSFGLARGSTLAALANPNFPFSIGADVVALELERSTIAGPDFHNASGDGQAGWKNLSFADLARAYDRGVALQPAFGEINSENSDLSAFKKHGGKLLTWHGLADQLIPPQGTIEYYNSVADKMGGLAQVQSFYRLYLAPGLGHGSPNGTSNPTAAPPVFSTGQMYGLITAWVEQGRAPEDVVLTSTAADGRAKSRPVCVYPKKARYQGGDANIAASYACG